MPAVTKQTNNRPKTGGFSFNPLGQTKLGLRFSIYGRGKTGKTRFATTFPKPLALIGTEDGTLSLGNIKGVQLGRIHNEQEMQGAIQIVKREKFATVVLDNASGLQDAVLKGILGLDELPAQKSWGMASREQWGQCAIQTKELLRELLGLAESAGINIVIIAHERNFKDEGDGGDSIIAPTVGSALSPSVAGWLNGACDYVCQTFIREIMTEKEVSIGTMKQKTLVRTGKCEFCLRVGPDPVFMTGFRLPPGRELPDSIVNPDYNKIIKLIKD